MVSTIKTQGKGKPAHQELRTFNPNAAGIDIGSTVHYVAVPPDRTDDPVRHFGCCTPDLHQMARWLKECGVETVMMESTGVYWIPVMQVLEQYELDVQLVDARHVSSVPGRDTDVDDCQWLQTLHSYGLLRGCFRPDDDVVVLRTYWRQRAGLVEMASRQILLMQKALEQMNLQLHKVLSDITGVTGMNIIRAIVSGERDPETLAAMRQPGVKKSVKEITDALTGDWREEHLFALKQALELFDIIQEKICECDSKTEECMSRFEAKADPKELPVSSSSKKGRRKNQPYFQLREHLYRITGVDLPSIDGIDAMTAQTVISECGLDLSAFPTEKHFSSWLGLCPKNWITGGKIKKRGSRKVQSRAAKALRLAAQSLHSSKSALGAYYRRMHARLGPAKAITATAHKLACLIYRMIRYGMDYVDKGQELYNQQYQERMLKRLHKQAQSLGYGLVNLETGEVS